MNYTMFPYLSAMLNANQLFGEAVKQVYEPDWSGRKKFVELLDVSLYLKNCWLMYNAECK